MTNQVIKEKDEVTLTYDKDARGVVVRVGPEMSEVRFSGNVYKYIPNRFITKRGSK